MSSSRAVWAIAAPAIASNAASAVIVLTDTWAVGQLGEATALAGMALAASALTLLVTSLNFLRMGTTALTAQAGGAHQTTEQTAVLVRAVAIGLALGLALSVLAPVLAAAAPLLFGASAPAASAATDYLLIRLLAAPLTLANLALVGWLIGRLDARPVLLAELVAMVVNALLCWALVVQGPLGIAGAAIASVGAESAKAVILLAVAVRAAGGGPLRRGVRDAATWRRRDLLRLGAVNRDLFARTLLLTLSFAAFTRTSAQGGEALLAANHVLFQLFLFGVLVLDGFEASAQALTGTALGARSRSALIATLRLNLGWGAACALLVATVLVAALPLVAPHMAKAPEVAALVVRYGAWLAPALLLGIWAFVLDGVYVGATWTRPLLATMALAVLAFGLALWGLPRVLGNDGLWAALCVLMVARAAAQTARLGGLVRTALPDATP